MAPKRPRFGSGEILFLIIMGVLILVVITHNHRIIMDTLYSPYTAFLAVVMLIEYLILKGADRSSIYRRELEAARQKRRDDLLAMREMEMLLVELRARMGSALERSDDAQRLREAAEDTQRTCDQVLQQLRGRI